MIPRAQITAWRSRAPWPDDDLVEQDLVLSRALIEIFSHPLLVAQLAFRGGTALHKLVFESPLRYSEDIDLVQLEAGPIGDIMRAVHDQLDGWLGRPSTRQNESGVKLVYAFEAESEPRARRKLKIEIQTREHSSVLGLTSTQLAVSNPWFEGEAAIPIYRPEELLGTKLGALYQRKKGRDLFDNAQALSQLDLSTEQIVDCFQRYTESTPISRARFEATLAAKIRDPAFTEDIAPLLSPDVDWDLEAGYGAVSRELIARLPGDPWKGSEQQGS